MTPDYRAGFEAALELLRQHDEIGSMFCMGSAHDIAEQIRIEGGLCSATEFMGLKERKMASIQQTMKDNCPRPFIIAGNADVLIDATAVKKPGPESFEEWADRTAPNFD
jgi:hypothetical protein